MTSLGTQLHCSGIPYFTVFHSGSVFSEPTNNLAPKAVDNKIRFTLMLTTVGEPTYVMCPVVGYPVPLFRYVKCLFCVEPTGKISPKVPGQKYEGGKIFNFPVNQTVVMTCDVVGYPVPLYR